MREHNAICDRLPRRYPSWADDADLRAGAAGQRGADGEDPHRRVDAGDPRPPDACRSRMRANWWGLAGERVHDAVRPDQRAARSISGIPGSPTDHHGVPYSHDRGVRRRLPDAPADPRRLRFRAAPTTDVIERARVPRHRTARRSRAVLRADRPWRTRSTPSASRIPARITLHNFPRFLQRLRAARRRGASTWPRSTSCASRERGVPRYNEFRRLLHMEPRRSVRRAGRRPGDGRAAARRSTTTTSRTST